MTARFDRDTALTPLGDGRFAGRMDRGWWIERGPNGGYVAAVILRGLAATAGAAVGTERPPRSLTVHYLAAPKEGSVELTTAVERSGRRLTFVGGRLGQDGRTLCIAQAVFGAPVEGPGFVDAVAPEVPPPESLVPPAGTALSPVPMRERYESLWALGPPPLSAGDRAEAGGWIRLADPRPVDHLLLTALADAWVPPVFGRSTSNFGVPTIDLTVHFRTAELPDDDWFLVHFRTRSCIEGYVEEDGEIWSRDGRLLVQSRQLALILASPG